MAWRVVILADVPNLVLGQAQLSAHISEMNPVMESTGGAQRRIVLTAEGTDALDAGKRALEAVRAALAQHLTGESVVMAVNRDDDSDPSEPGIV